MMTLMFMVRVRYTQESCELSCQYDINTRTTAKLGSAGFVAQLRRLVRRINEFRASWTAQGTSLNHSGIFR